MTTRSEGLAILLDLSSSILLPVSTVGYRAVTSNISYKLWHWLSEDVFSFCFPS